MINIDKNKVKIIGTEFQIYKDQIKPTLSSFIREETNKEPLKSFLIDLFDIYLFSLFLLDEKKIILDENFGSLGFIYMRSSIIIYSITKLLENGIYSEVFTLNRSLCELYLSLKILTEKDFNERSELFLNFNWVKKYQKAEASPDFFLESEKNEINTNYQRIKENYSSKKYQKGFDWTWHFYERVDKRGSSIYSMFDRLNLIDEYKKYFNNFSEFVHPSPLFLNTFKNKEGRFSCGPNYSNWIYKTGIISVYYFNKILVGIVNSIRVDGYESIMLLLANKFKGFTEKHKK